MHAQRSSKGRPRPFGFHATADPTAAVPAIAAPEARFVPVEAGPDVRAAVARWRAEALPLAKRVIDAEHNPSDVAGVSDVSHVSDVSDVSDPIKTNTSSSSNSSAAAFQSLRVYAMVRPVLPDLFPGERDAAPHYETTTACSPYLFLHAREVRLGLPTGRVHSTPQRFDRVFGPGVASGEVFAGTVGLLVDGAARRGERGMAIAFGQTGSGKTHTVRSWMQSTIARLFGESLAVAQVNIQYFEIRGAKVLDLLAERAPCELRVDARGDVHVQGARSVACRSADEAWSSIEQGVALRATKATKSNKQSSRSHAVCVFNIGGQHGGGRVQLIDLAGSERSSDATTHTSELITELQEINGSLGALKAAIRAMYLRDVCQKTSTHVNYRASKLTLLLKEMFEPKKKTQSTGSTGSGGGGEEEVIGEHKEAKQEDARTTPPRSSSCMFLACFAPLETQVEHTQATAKYCRQLLAVASTRDGTREATPEELIEGLQLFYLDTCPERASKDAVAGVLASFKGREATLHRGLKKKYGRAPGVLLRAPRAKGAPVPPLEWSRKRMMHFVKTLNGGAVAAYHDKFRMTGSQMFGMSVHDVIRRCGGAGSCAAFNTPDHALNDIGVGGAEAEEGKGEGGKEVEEAAAAVPTPDEVGREIFEAFRLRVQKSKVGN